MQENWSFATPSGYCGGMTIFTYLQLLYVPISSRFTKV
jgi:hypothetical protein